MRVTTTPRLFLRACKRCFSATFLCGIFAASVHAQVPTDPSKTGELIPATPGSLSTLSLPSSVIANTRVGAGDILRVTVFGQEDLSAEIGVNDKGYITLPLIGPLGANGLSTSELALKVTDALLKGGYVRNPQVSVEVIQSRSQMVSVLGEISRPGRYPIPGHMTVLELLAIAGGLTERAEQTVTLLRRPDPNDTNDAGQRIPIQLGEAGPAQLARRTPLDVELRSGDVVYVASKKLFYIHGEVNRPGSYQMEPGMNVMRAIALGGGMTQRASTRRMTINRKTESQGLQEFKAGMSEALEPGDVVYVNESLF
ncbi:SLBB domain-containing protein [Herbaspirillum sp. RTI4]|uniref:SLBB domain-containing protein n=1 Tax=Herbaspirillum sp. RTI4 TaxID=3048640 RepID=UPI002AB5188F|nr:SLBB domain-containing protein [Herbaspirillum sp. RTI4]MDY7578268.1 SLBB domain-containing protein [Herbaspirillum sp. RTI4]MEA9981239.1 SLBB domain-containing protein [Herbaspirillum sp. RTI4]